MSVEVLPHSIFEVVQKPDTLDGQSVGQAVLDWVAEYIPFDDFEGVGDLSDALKIKKANCFAQTRAQTELLQQGFEIPAATMITANSTLFCHASVAGLVPEYDSVFGKVVFIEPPIYRGEGFANDILTEAFVKAQGPNKTLPHLMADNLPAAMESRDFCHYYFIDPDFPDESKALSHKQPWIIKKTSGIRQFERIQKDGFSFMVTDPAQGEKMLGAISTLSRLYGNDREGYRSVYDELIQHVPDFMYFPPPRSPAEHSESTTTKHKAIQ